MQKVPIHRSMLVTFRTIMSVVQAAKPYFIDSGGRLACKQSLMQYTSMLLVAMHARYKDRIMPLQGRAKDNSVPVSMTGCII